MDEQLKATILRLCDKTDEVIGDGDWPGIMKSFIILASGVLALAVVLSGFTLAAAAIRAMEHVHSPRYNVTRLEGK